MDFSNVTFISRSFADELCDIMDEYSGVRLMNESPLVERMINIVMTCRKRIRQRNTNTPSIENLNTMEEVSRFFATI